MRNLLLAAFLLFAIALSAQNASFGVNIGALDFENNSGLYMSGNVRAQLTDRFAWQTEAGYGRLDQEFTESREEITFEFGREQITTVTNTYRKGAMVLKTGLATKLITIGGLNAELITSAGMFKGDKDIRLLVGGELFLSARIGKNLVAGIPVSYNYVTWDRDQFYTGGISLRFHM